MPYAYTVNPGTGGVPGIPGQPLVLGDAIVHQIVETEVSATDEWTVSNIPKVGTVTLFEAELAEVGTATVLQPEIGLADGFVIGTLDGLVPVRRAGSLVRAQNDLRYTSTKGVLVGRSVPDGVADRVVTRVTIHRGTADDLGPRVFRWFGLERAGDAHGLRRRLFGVRAPSQGGTVRGDRARHTSRGRHPR